jgi:hypothetical protein
MFMMHDSFDERGRREALDYLERRKESQIEDAKMKKKRELARPPKHNKLRSPYGQRK